MFILIHSLTFCLSLAFVFYFSYNHVQKRESIYRISLMKVLWSSKLVRSHTNLPSLPSFISFQRSQTLFVLFQFIFSFCQKKMHAIFFGSHDTQARRRDYHIGNGAQKSVKGTEHSTEHTLFRYKSQMKRKEYEKYMDRMIYGFYYLNLIVVTDNFKLNEKRTRSKIQYIIDILY